MAAAYLIVESNISDPQKFKAYMASAPAVVREFAGEYLVRGGRMAVLEGDWAPTRLTVLRYPDFETAQQMYDSPAYRAVRELRAGTTACFNMVLVEGVAAPVV
ncbi:MAG TPA: DUF1330 domain-containing protein [Rubrivivax sp.]|nr:DUF1330 domain-containing protein [Rubrivivax sp.]